MVDVTTSGEIGVQLPANDTVSDRSARTQHDRPSRILDLREAIERGEYRVAASNLADAMLRLASRVN